MIKATYKDKSIAIDIITNSFKDNLSVHYVAGTNINQIKKLIEYSFLQAINFGEVLFNDDKTACCFIINPKQKRTTIKSIIWDIKLLFSVIGIVHLSKVLKKEKIVLNNHPKNKDYIHLWYIGVKPSLQGQGIGTNFLKEIQAYSTLPIYLETSIKNNVSFYEKNNFKLYNEYHFGFIMYMFKYVK